jgi:hypothetical protein
MEHDVKFSRAEEVVVAAMMNLEIAQDKYAQVRNSERKMAKGNKGESTPTNSDSLETAKLAYEKAAQAVDAAKLAITMEGAKAL